VKARLKSVYGCRAAPLVDRQLHSGGRFEDNGWSSAPTIRLPSARCKATMVPALPL